MNQYQAVLNKEYKMFLWGIVAIIIFVIVAIFFLIVVVQKISEKKERLLTFIAVIATILMMIFIAAMSATYAWNIKKDIDESSFVTYYGEYELVYERSFSVCYIYDGKERIELRCVDSLYHGSQPVKTGYVVYSKNSLYAVDIYE